MRTLTFIDKGKIDWREVPEVRVEAGIEAVIRPSVIGRCDLDLAYVQGLDHCARSMYIHQRREY